MREQFGVIEANGDNPGKRADPEQQITAEEARPRLEANAKTGF